jgi:hypothetical protein
MRLLAKLLWEGNQARMADGLGVSPPVISRVLAGQQQPTGKLLAALAGRADINLRWVLTGEGEPVLEPGMGPGRGRFLPVVDGLLTGPPGEQPHLLSGTSYPVAEAFYSASSYWYRIPAGARVIASDEMIAVGDKLLMESDEKLTRRSGAVLGRFCGIRVRAGNRENVVLAKVNSASEVYFEPCSQFCVDTFGDLGELWLIVPEPGAGAGAGAAARGLTKRKEATVVGLESIACVCMRLDRGFSGPAQ